jgi:hypothetical protein
MSNEAIDAAFPVPHFTRPDGDIEWGSFGLTKREMFAAMAMQGLLSNSGGPIQANGMTGWGLTNVTHDQVAAVAARFADALLAELAK